MTTERLEEFAVLANILNYSQAADKLFLSQPVLSRHIKELEEETGCTLFYRDTHSVSLTDEGKYLLRWVLPLLEKTEHLSSAITNENENKTGKINMLCADQSLDTRVLEFIRRFIEHNPEIRVNVSNVRAESKKELIYSYDIYITPVDYMNALKQDTEGTLLMIQQALLVIPPAHHLSDMEEVHLEDLRGETLMIPFMDDIFGPYNRNASAAFKKCQGTLHKLGVENDQEGLLKVELGEGVMLIPYNLQSRIYPHTQTIPVDDKDCFFPIYAYLNKTTGNMAAEVFYRKLKEEFSGRKAK